MLYLVKIIVIGISFVFVLFNFLENARRIRANDREYNSQFHYAVSVKIVKQIEWIMLDCYFFYLIINLLE